MISSGNRTPEHLILSPIIQYLTQSAGPRAPDTVYIQYKATNNWQITYITSYCRRFNHKLFCWGHLPNAHTTSCFSLIVMLACKLRTREMSLFQSYESNCIVLYHAQRFVNILEYKLDTPSVFWFFFVISIFNSQNFKLIPLYRFSIKLLIVFFMILTPGKVAPKNCNVVTCNLKVGLSIRSGCSNRDNPSSYSGTLADDLWMLSIK